MRVGLERPAEDFEIQLLHERDHVHASTGVVVAGAVSPGFARLHTGSSRPHRSMLEDQGEALWRPQWTAQTLQRAVALTWQGYWD
jgi:hypothetical protein